MRSEYKLSPRQQIILLLGIVTIIAMGLYPPWEATYHGENRTTVESFAGYRLVSRPPYAATPSTGIGIDTDRLLIQWLGTVLVTCGLIWLLQQAPYEPYAEPYEEQMHPPRYDERSM